MAKNCPACGAEIVYRGRGRPRRYCESCTPPGSSTGAWLGAWLNEHHDELEAKRRKEHAEFMAQWRVGIREHLKRTEQNRKKRERRKTAA
jgi:hypothetical protein